MKLLLIIPALTLAMTALLACGTAAPADPAKFARAQPPAQQAAAIPGPPPAPTPLPTSSPTPSPLPTKLAA